LQPKTIKRDLQIVDETTVLGRLTRNLERCEEQIATGIDMTEESKAPRTTYVKSQLEHEIEEIMGTENPIILA